ncbi:hypothetical protein jhhlp_008096 [Lomentospora prolificans]|uniref:SigF-like NTF2-like domain-containing protein n=1 Tax=Lomentospora prolificans TaxID=41688 RepID=A0A2N3MZH4_9PEZI|nr:hypothetical protein jhhlp_008096 [Lomentospora prolificans]
MENPETDIRKVLHGLCCGDVAEQTATVAKYFVADASFEHPFCRVPSFSGLSVPGSATLDSRWLVLMIYRWYRILSPRVDLQIDSCAFDDTAGILYVNLRQNFAVWFIPFYNAPVRLVSALTLRAVDKRSLPQESNSSPERRPLKVDETTEGDKLYFIARQQDYYQVNDSLRFISLCFGAAFWAGFQLFATSVCVGLGLVCLPFYYQFWPNWAFQSKQLFGLRKN